jgi:HEAT repeat protein
MMTHISCPCPRIPAAVAAILIMAVFSVSCRSAVAADEAIEFKGSFELRPIVRFSELPRRMYLEPTISVPPDALYVKDGVLELLERMLVSGPDNEIRIQAIKAIEKIHTAELGSVAHLVQSIRKHLAESGNIHVRQACASALAAIGHAESAAEVAQMCLPEFEALCVRIEPNFVSWGADALKPTWIQRVRSPEGFSTVQLQLATEGLVQLNETAANTALESILKNELAEFVIRHSAARALSTLDQQKAAATAETYVQGGVPDRLLACALLGRCSSDSGIALLSQLCDDESNAVAARAWKTMLDRAPEQLVKKLGSGVSHQESNVRFAAIRTISLFPTEDGCRMLHVLAGDIHIGVRNSARQVLAVFADTNADLRYTILQNAGGTLSDPDVSWQQLEQSLILLGQLKHREWQKQCLPLLDHDRPEVFATAAWLLHLMPQHDIAELVGEATLKRHKLYQTAQGSDPLATELAIQLTFLFQHAGFTELQSLQKLCERQFSKGEGDPEKRAAALWALGKINSGNADPTITGKLVERIFDDNPVLPEYFIVRRMSVLALVWMNARSTVPDMHRIRKMYGVRSLLGQTARWAIPQLGAEQPPKPEPLNIPVEDFPISPL